MFITQPKIFVSSTIADLPSERKAALNAIERVGGVPIMSEFTIEAQNADSVTACIDKVKTSNIYILILGARYGWQPEGEESITELEYKAAVEQHVPIIVFNTTYPKEQFQKDFEQRVESKYFRKSISDAFELERELETSLRAEIEKKNGEFFEQSESVFSNLVKIEFPTSVYISNLDIDKKEIREFNKGRGYKFKRKPSLHDYAVSALFMHEISFPHDWIIKGKNIITFHDLTDSDCPLTRIVDRGTTEPISCEEFYSSSVDNLSTFKYLLKKCLNTKLHKLRISWIKDEKLFAFLPIKKDALDRWENRKIEWSKKKKASRTVVKVKYNLKNEEEVFNMKCLAFRVTFELLDGTWLLAIKPDWIILWPSLKVCDYAYKDIQWQKRNERNIHVFNHFNFVLHYLQPSITEGLFEEFKDYPFLKIGKIQEFDFKPSVPDSIWNHLEPQGEKRKLKDQEGNIDLFGYES